MGSRLGDLKKVIDDIREKVDSICHEKCSEYKLDEKKVFGGETAETHNEGIGESSEKEKTYVPNGNGSSISPKTLNAPSTEDDTEDVIVDDDDDDNDAEAEMEKEIKRRIDAINRRNGHSDEESSTDNEKNDARREWKTLFRHDDSTTDADLVPKVGQYAPKPDNNSGSALGGLLALGGKRLVKRAMKRAAGKRLAMSGAKAAGKGLAKAGTKVAAKGVGKAAAKSLAKKLPFGLGLIPATAFAAGRAIDGDFSGAGLEMASGAAAAVPWVGTAGSFGIDAYLADRDVKKETGKGLLGHGKDAAAGLVGKMAKKALAMESFEKYNTLYDRAKAIFESESGVNESVDGYRFDDYVLESKIDNLAVSRDAVDESKVFFGYTKVCESFSSDVEDEELERLFKQISPDGKVSMSDLTEKDTDTPSVAAAKRRVKEILGGGHRKSAGSSPANMDMNAKQSKKAFDLSTDSGGKLTQLQKIHGGFDQLGNSVARGLENNMFIPQEVSKKLNIPKNLGRLAGAGVGGLMFGPVGAIGGGALANWLINRHEKYKAKQYAKLHGLDEKKVHGEKNGYTGSLVGAGIGSLLGGPFGGIMGAGFGHLFDRKSDARVDK